MERKKEAEKKLKRKKDDPAEPEVVEKKDNGADVIHSEACMHACKIIERMVNQNTYDDITQVRVRVRGRGRGRVRVGLAHGQPEHLR